ncbi:lectin 2b [Suillus ampliporus]|nr:lectin 2b [Suillus ampliporus]
MSAPCINGLQCGQFLQFQSSLQSETMPSYTITVRTVDTTVSYPKDCSTTAPSLAGFTIAEKTVWYYSPGSWSNTESIQTLDLENSGSSGSLRFRNGAGEEFFVVLGVHNYQRWCDVVVDLAPAETGMKIHPQYYDEGNPKYHMLWKQLTEITKTSTKGTTVDVKYINPVEVDNLVVHITISSAANLS